MRKPAKYTGYCLGCGRKQDVPSWRYCQACDNRMDKEAQARIRAKKRLEALVGLTRGVKEGAKG